MTMFNSETVLPMASGVAAVSLTDTDLEQVAGGIFFLPIVAGVAVGLIVGGATLAVLVGAADAVSHHTGHGCLLA
jgi:mannose/fructose/N-acetylgalactosamine-specific phosphotransferase system component IIC